jgi:hypothetical protein
MYKVKITGWALFGAILSASTFASDFSDVDEYQKKSDQNIYDTAVNAPKLCLYLSDEGCSQMMRIPGFEVSSPTLHQGDKVILSELLDLTPSDVEKGDGKAVPEARRNILKQSALTLGVSVGISVESTRYNNLWHEYSDLYDYYINFEALLIESGTGRNIVPPVIFSMGDSRSVGAGGQVFRVAEAVFRIAEQPKFVTTTPTWRDYLSLDIDRPEMPLSGFLPSSSAEAEIWKVYLVQGYLKGIETTQHRVHARYQLLKSHYAGMAFYHVLLAANMISRPIVELAHSPVLTTHAGSVMAIDDTIYVLSVQPILNHNRESWKAYPLLKRLGDVQRESYQGAASYAR